MAVQLPQGIAGQIANLQHLINGLPQPWAQGQQLIQNITQAAQIALANQTANTQMIQQLNLNLQALAIQLVYVQNIANGGLQNTALELANAQLGLANQFYGLANREVALVLEQASAALRQTAAQINHNTATSLEIENLQRAEQIRKIFRNRIECLEHLENHWSKMKWKRAAALITIFWVADAENKQMMYKRNLECTREALTLFNKTFAQNGNLRAEEAFATAKSRNRVTDEDLSKCYVPNAQGGYSFKPRW